MSTDLVSEFERLLIRQGVIHARISATKAAYEAAVAEGLEVDNEVVRVRRSLQALERSVARIKGEDPLPQTGTKVRDEGPVPAPDLSTPPRPDGIRESFWVVVLAIPRDGETTMEDLRRTLGLSESSLNNRVSKMKNADLIESAGWGRYKLTEKGRWFVGQRLQVVSNNVRS